MFIGDLHLGARGRQAELLLDFLQHADFHTLHRVGDVVDGWRLKSGWRWRASHDIKGSRNAAWRPAFRT